MNTELTPAERDLMPEHVLSDTEECWCGPTVIQVPGVPVATASMPNGAGALRSARDFFRELGMSEAAEHCEQMALGLDSGLGECIDADCHPWQHGHNPETDEATCATCTWPSRETTNLVCQTCGWDYANGEKP